MGSPTRLGILPTDPVVMDDPVIKDIAAKKGITPAQVYTKVHSSIHLPRKTVYELIFYFGVWVCAVCVSYMYTHVWLCVSCVVECKKFAFTSGEN